MNSTKLLAKLQLRRQQCCRAFSMASSHQQKDNQTGALFRVLSEGLNQQRSSPSASSQSSITPAAFARKLLGEKQDTLGAMRRDEMARQIHRRWKPGDVYSPHDLSFQEQQKYKPNPRKAPKYDVFDLLGIDPVKEYKNFALMSEFMGDTGRILHSKKTGLTPRNQRKIAKAIRRAIGLGLMPSVHRHPEILERQMIRRGERFY